MKLIEAVLRHRTIVFECEKGHDLDPFIPTKVCGEQVFGSFTYETRECVVKVEGPLADCRAAVQTINLTKVPIRHMVNWNGVMGYGEHNMKLDEIEIRQLPQNWEIVFFWYEQ